MGKPYGKYLRELLDNNILEEIFEHFDLDPEEALIKLHLNGDYNLDYYMDDEFVEEEEDDQS